MSAKELILIQEKVKQSPAWNSTSGIFADFGDGFDKPKYYCRCPNCSYVHGHYKTPREAIYKKLCPLCDARGIAKLQKEIRNVDVRKPVRQVQPKPLMVDSLVENLLDPQDFAKRHDQAGNFDTWETWIPYLKQEGLQVLRRGDDIAISNPETGHFLIQDYNSEPDSDALYRMLAHFEQEWHLQVGQHIED